MSKLNKSYVDSLEPREKAFDAWDQGSGNISGFCVQVSPKGKKTYYYIYRVKGDSKKKRINLGVHGQITCEQARELAKKHAADIVHQKDPRAEQKKIQKKKKEEDTQGILFKEFLPIFIQRHSESYKKESTKNSDADNFKNHILPFFGKKKLNEITRKDVFEFRDSLHNKKATCNRCLALVSVIFNKAILWEYLPEGHNPCSKVAKYKENKKERFLDETELTILINTLDTYQHLKLETSYVINAIKMLIYTGCRRGEILTLKWADVQLDQNCIHLKDSKTGEKIVPLNSMSKSILENIQRQPGNPYVFCGKNPRTHLISIKKTWDKIRKQLNLKDVRLHDLRHTFASLAIKSGLGIFEVSKLLGHKNISTTMRYAHTNREDLVKNAKLMESAFIFSN